MCAKRSRNPKSFFLFSPFRCRCSFSSLGPSNGSRPEYWVDFTCAAWKEGVGHVLGERIERWGKLALITAFTVTLRANASTNIAISPVGLFQVVGMPFNAAERSPSLDQPTERRSATREKSCGVFFFGLMHIAKRRLGEEELTRCPHQPLKDTLPSSVSSRPRVCAAPNHGVEVFSCLACVPSIR